MIPRKPPGNQTRNNFTDPLKLLSCLGLSPEAVHFSAQAAADFHFNVPASYVDQIQPGDPTDPLLRQILPVQQELEIHPGYSKDPLAEADSLFQPGLLQKYHGRALLLVTPACTINCRYCFRRHYPYDDKGHFSEQINKNISLIKQDNSITEVILSGGDPLSLSSARLTELITQLEAIKHVKRLRIHSRYPVVEPQRVDDELTNVLRSSRFHIIMVLHINHPDEIGTDSQTAIKKLHTVTAMLFNQSVLLKGVNDKVSILQHLSEKLIENQIIPYYLHLLDPVQGSAHFAVSEQRTIEIYQQLRAILPGYMLPKLVREIAGESSKLPVYLKSEKLPVSS